MKTENKPGYTKDWGKSTEKRTVHTCNSCGQLVRIIEEIGVPVCIFNAEAPGAGKLHSATCEDMQARRQKYRAVEEVKNAKRVVGRQFILPI